MGRIDELNITRCIIELPHGDKNYADFELEKVNARISQTLGVELRDYTRRVDDALTLIPDGWNAEITWQRSPQQFSVILSAPDTSGSCVSYWLRNGEKIFSALPIAICSAALNVHLHMRKQATRKRRGVE